MEAGRSLLSSPPSISRTHLRDPLSPSSVVILHGQVCRAIISTSTISAVRPFPTSILTKEQNNGYSNSYAIQEDKVAQEITADPEIEIPKIIIEKQMMRQHVRRLLGVLSPRERKLIRLRFGIQRGEPKSFQQIGDMFGISKERVRQLESQAMNKMRACCTSQGLGAYA